MLRALKISLGSWLGAFPARARTEDSAAGSGSRGLQPGLALAGVLAVAALAYRSLALWDPGAPGLPGIGWFVFGISDTAPQVVLAIVAALVFQRRGRLVRAGGEPRAPLLGLAASSLSVLLFLWGRHVDAPQFLVLSLAFFLLGSALIVFGRRAGRELAPPLLVLLFAIPIPGIVLNHVLLPLQAAGASQLAWLLDVLGVPVVREGIVLQLADKTIEVIETCSGLRGITMLTMLAVCWATFFSLRPLATLLLLISAPLIALAVNAARLLIVALSPYADLEAAHTFQGVAVFMAGIALLCVVDAILRRTLGAGGSVESAGRSGGLPPGWQRRALAPALLALVLLAASIWLPSPPQPERGRSWIDLPASVAGWELVDGKVEIDGLFLGRAMVRGGRAHRSYEKAGEQVTVFVAYDDRRDLTRSVLSPKMGLPGPSWEVEERGRRALGPESLDARWLVARSQAHRVAVLHWYLGVEELGSELVRAWLALDRSALRRPCGSVAVRLQTEQAGGVEGARRAEARLLEVADGLAPYLADLLCTGPRKLTPQPRTGAGG